MNKVKVEKIFCILGYSNTGKDEISKEVVKKMDKLKFLVSHTTRPIRANEEDGREYYFVSEDKFKNMKDNNKFIECRSYNTKIEKDGVSMDDVWYYGLSKKEVDNTKYGLCIVDAKGFKELKSYYGRGVVIPIYIKADEEELKQRAINRGDLLEEFERRLNDDRKAFFNFRLKIVFDTILNKDGMLDKSVNEVCSIIKKYIDESENQKCRKKK